MKNKFNFLIGTWKVTRSLGQIGHGEGTVKIMPSNTTPDLLEYTESLDVYFHPQTKPINAYRKYYYKYDPQTGCIIKLFEDQRPFYQLKFSEDLQKATGEHLCAQDNYWADYSFLDNSSFTLSYKAKGPEKDYIITTEFERISTEVNSEDNILGSLQEETYET